MTPISDRPLMAIVAASLEVPVFCAVGPVPVPVPLDPVGKEDWPLPVAVEPEAVGRAV